MEIPYTMSIFAAFLLALVDAGTIQLPPLAELKKLYPGYYHFGGLYRNREIVRLLGIENSVDMLLHDTTALRLSYTFNRLGNQHSLGNDVIRLSKNGIDSVPGEKGAQYIFHPLAFGPYLADKYGYPTVTKMHLFDPVRTKESFTNKQGIMRVITYTQHDNEPKGHIVLWDCNGAYQSRDFFSGHTLLSVEFWESPDSRCEDPPTELDQSKHELDDRDSYILSVLRNSRHGTKHRRQTKDR